MFIVLRRRLQKFFIATKGYEMNRHCIYKFLALAAGGLYGLAGCGGSDGGEPMGTLNIGLTDAPVDNAVAVVIQFTGLELKSAGGPPQIFPLDKDSCDEYSSAGYCSIDLISLQGTEYRTVFVENLPAGEYQWLRLLVNAELNVHDSYVTVEDEITENLINCSLWIPSGAETGLKIVSGITVTENAVSNYMLDFDARASITQPPGLPPTTACEQNYILKPAVRIVDETEAGSIAGIVDRSVLYTMNDRDEEVLVDGCRDEAPMDNVVDHLNVYVFEDFDSQIDPIKADDYDGEDDPITSAIVEWNGTDYTYEVGFLREGDYRLGLTCTADVDVMPDLVGSVVDNFDCNLTEPAPCEQTTPAFGFVAERQVRVLAETLNNGDIPEPVQDP